MSEDAPNYGKPNPPTLAELVAAEREKLPPPTGASFADEYARLAASYAGGGDLYFRYSDGSVRSVFPQRSLQAEIEGKDRTTQIVIAIALLEAEHERLVRAGGKS